MNRAAKIIHLDYARKLSLTGKGIGVAIMDTGIGYHPDLFPEKGGARMAAFLDTINGHKHYYDDNGHGTHIAGILAGSGKTCNGLFEGIAPECHFVIIKVLNNRGEGNIENVLAGIHWLLLHHKDYNIRIVNISVGSTRGKNFTEDSPLVKGVNSLWEAGMAVFTAAGNNGPSPYSIGAPGNSRKIITVGSSDIAHTENEKDYSGRGPTSSCIKKPDIVAPGSHIISCFPMASPDHFQTVNSTHALAETPVIYNNASYLSRTGTSMSTPIVSGCSALLLEKYPFLTNKDIKLCLRNTALNLGYAHARQGWGLIRCDRFLR